MSDSSTNQILIPSENTTEFAIHKIFDSPTPSLSELLNIYVNQVVLGGSKHTVEAKINDIQKFVNFFKQNGIKDHPDFWTVSLTKHFQNTLKNSITIKGEKFKATTINRIIASIKHAAKWIHKQRPFKTGFPLEGIKDLHTDDPDWKGLTSKQIMQLKIACDIRMKICTRQNQNPKLESALFYSLLYTGMRKSELISLNIQHYHTRGFHNVKRKGNKITRKVPLPAEAKEKLDLYLETRPNLLPEEPLFLSRYGNRLLLADVNIILDRISKQALTHLPEHEKFKLTPHMLRHTFLRKIADKEGIHIAHDLSGNVSIKEIFRYTKPSQDEKDAMAEDLVF